MTAHNKRTGAKAQSCVNYQQYLQNDTPSTLIADDFESAQPFILKFYRGIEKLFKVCPLPSKLGPQQTYVNSIVPLDYRIDDDGTPCTKQFSTSQTAFRNASQFTVDVLKEHHANASLLILDRGRQFVQSWKDYLFSDFYDPYISNGAIPTFFIYRTAFLDKIMSVTTSDDISDDDIEIRFHRPSGGVIDASFVIIWCISMTCVTGGGLWAYHRHRAGKDISHVSQRVDDDVSDNETKGFFEKHGNVVTIVFMMCTLCIVLMLGYYFRPFLVYFFNIFLVIFGSCSLYGCIRGLISNFPFVEHRWYNAKMEWFPLCCGRKSQFKYSEMLIALICLSFCITWFVLRRQPYAFILLDIINMALCLHVLKCLRLPSLKWISILMLCMFFYDAVMVFGTPYMTSNGCSIMLEVATGLSCAAKGKSKGYPVPPVEQDEIPEKFPMLMQVAHFNPMNECLDMEVELGYQFTILGLGDIVMPGYLVAHCFTMNGFSERVRMFYGIVSVVGYGVGLVVTFLALALMKTAQPALIYLVPSTLIPIMLMAVCRREFLKIWQGVPSDSTPLLSGSPDSTMDPIDPNLVVNAPSTSSSSASSSQQIEPVNV